MHVVSYKIIQHSKGVITENEGKGVGEWQELNLDESHISRLRRHFSKKQGEGRGRGGCPILGMTHPRVKPFL